MDGGEVDANAGVVLPKDMPMFKTHRLPNSRFDNFRQETTAAVGMNTNLDKTESPSENFTVPTLPRVKAGWRASSGNLRQTPPVDIKERLRLFATRSMYDLTEPSDDSPDSSFKHKRPTSSFTAPDTNNKTLLGNPPSEEEKLSLSLDNMLCLNTSS
ncbi:neuroblast differentiation-associated protein AHNAK isoform X2 [Silurus meridionalis]|nr:neuroblast differentiation-associated protein AHNAK isoform X2 [Silurus meridionalis]